MFRCLECGELFKEPLEYEETHGLDTPPYEKMYVCPKCKGHGYSPLIKDTVSRREILDKLVDIMQALNEFEYAVCDTFSESALDDTRFDWARSDMYELILSIADIEPFKLPANIDDMIFSARSFQQTAAVYRELTKNIEN